MVSEKNAASIFFAISRARDLPITAAIAGSVSSAASLET